MFHFFQTIFSGVTSLLAGAIIAIGLVSVPTTEIKITQNPTPPPQNEEILIVQETKTQKTEEQKPETTLAPVPVKPSGSKTSEATSTLEPATTPTSAPTPTSTPTPQPQSKTPKTFTTPSGAVVDEVGNVISGPTKVIPSTVDTNITAGTKVLSAEEIYSLISPSVVLIESSEGHGTGFVIENGKYTLTNEHVVGSDSKVTLTFQDGVSISALVLGRNSTADIALIYNNGLSLKAVTFGLSEGSSLKTGADVYALGFPLTFTKTVTLTRGVVSANRQQISFGLLIQTDASIHPGNSGGPLVNNKGEVIGINEAGVVVQGNNSSVGGTGIGFAIPIETAKNLIPSLSQYGQSRYEVYPIGSTFTIKRSFAWRIGFNSNLSCSQLGFTSNDLTLCELYKNYFNDYQWSFIEDMSQ